MDTTFSNAGGSRVTVHDVAQIRASADFTVQKNGKPLYWQTLVFIDQKGRQIGAITLYLEEPAAALPVGDQPPYWGVDPSKPLAVADGQPPF